MKKIIALSGILALSSMQAMANSQNPQEETNGPVTAALAIGGAFIAGPVGMFLGVVGGSYLEDTIEKAEQADSLQTDLDVAQQQLLELQNQLVLKKQHNQQYEQLAFEQLQLEVMFKTEQSALSDTNTQRLAQLAQFLQDNSDVAVRLIGLADPRGTESYNLDLSQQRVQAVTEQLTSQGVELERIFVHFFGASRSTAAMGDYDAYALERVVKIHLINQKDTQQLSQIEVTD